MYRLNYASEWLRWSRRHPLPSFFLLGVFAVAAIGTGGVTKDPMTDILGDWQPLSRVYDKFGDLKLETNRLVWKRGPSSKYTVATSDEHGVLIALDSENPPVLHGTRYLYARLKYRPPNPEDWSPKAVLEASFFETKQDVDANRVSMWGAYLKPRD